MDSKIRDKVYENEIPHQEKSIKEWKQKFSELYLDMFHDIQCNEMSVHLSLKKHDMIGGVVVVNFDIY